MTTSSASTSFNPLMRRVSRWFPTDQYSDPLSRFRAYCSYGFSSVIIFAGIMIILLVALQSTSQTATGNILAQLLVALVILVAGAISSIMLIRTGRQRIAGWLICATFEIALLISFILLPPVLTSLIIFAIAEIWGLLTICALLLTISDLSFILMFALINVLVIVLRFGNLIPEGPWIFAGFLVLGVISHAISTALLMRIQRVAAGQAGIMLTRADRFAQAAQAITQIATRTPEAAPFMVEATQMIRTKLPELDSVQIWQADSTANRRSGALFTLGSSSGDTVSSPTPEAGLLNLLNRTSDTAKPIRVQESTGLLAGMRSQMMLPMRSSEYPIGVLIFASSRPDAFVDDDLVLAQPIADQISLTLENARLRSEQRVLFVERQRLTDELRSRQMQLERENQRTTALNWNDYLQVRNVDEPVAFTLDFQSGQVDSYAEWTEALQRATATGQPYNAVTEYAPEGGIYQTIALPLVVQGNIIGALEFEFAPGQETTTEQIAILQQMLQETAFAVDNARLVEESQRAARREALATAIGARLQNTSSVESVLANAAQSLADILHVPRISIRLTESPDNFNQRGNTP